MKRFLTRGLLGLSLFAAAHAEAAMINIKVLSNNSVQIEGQIYATDDALKGKLIELSHRQPKPDITLVAAPGSDFKKFAHLVELVSNDGFRVGFLTEPRPTSP